jgi:hypothetical protein
MTNSPCSPFRGRMMCGRQRFGGSTFDACTGSNAAQQRNTSCKGRLHGRRVRSESRMIEVGGPFQKAISETPVQSPNLHLTEKRAYL